jgi:hypothetical protein
MFRSVLVRSALKRQLTPAVSLGISAIVGSLLAASCASAVTTPSVPQSIQLVNATRSAEVPLAERVSVMAIAFGGSVAICLGANKLLDRGQLQPSTHRPFATTAFHQPMALRLLKQVAPFSASFSAWCMTIAHWQNACLRKQRSDMQATRPIGTLRKSSMIWSAIGASFRSAVTLVRRDAERDRHCL